ncbi:DnaD domain protein [Pseudobacillus sp. FSL P4-0506]|uniref:DnaD domain-containing protein n=1 Tax=Pseudobacillus sp. FSL P4-0506 TaxID=2921576 RepID=UPI0030F950C3
MNYIKEINAFYDWLEINELSPSAINLWYALMHINNKAGWTDTFTVAESVLCVKTGLTDRTLRKVRNELKQKGRIDFISRKGKAPIYKMISFERTESNSELPQGLENISELRSALIKLNKTKQKDKEDEEDKRALVNPFQFYEQEGFGQLSGFVADKLGSLVDDYGESLVLHAMGEAVLYGARNLKYVESILKNPNKKRGEESGQKVYQHRRSYGRSTGKGKSVEQAYRELEEARRAWGG